MPIGKGPKPPAKPTIPLRDVLPIDPNDVFDDNYGGQRVLKPADTFVSGDKGHRLSITTGGAGSLFRPNSSLQISEAQIIIIDAVKSVVDFQQLFRSAVNPVNDIVTRLVLTTTDSEGRFSEEKFIEAVKRFSSFAQNTENYSDNYKIREIVAEKIALETLFDAWGIDLINNDSLDKTGYIKVRSAFEKTCLAFDDALSNYYRKIFFGETLMQCLGKLHALDRFYTTSFESLYHELRNWYRVIPDDAPQIDPKHHLFYLLEKAYREYSELFEASDFGLDARPINEYGAMLMLAADRWLSGQEPTLRMAVQGVFSIYSHYQYPGLIIEPIKFPSKFSELLKFLSIGHYELMPPGALLKILSEALVFWGHKLAAVLTKIDDQVELIRENTVTPKGEKITLVEDEDHWHILTLGAFQLEVEQPGLGMLALDEYRQSIFMAGLNPMVVPELPGLLQVH